MTETPVTETPVTETLVTETLVCTGFLWGPVSLPLSSTDRRF
ncbi:hypothetical protein N9Z54_05040 [Planctomycetota bacterium]|nr:hypothetical protein [Planctomycetota bacterium]